MNDGKRELIKRIYLALQTGEIVKSDMLLPERELAEFFQVRRSYLREALIALEALGIIDIKERQGMFFGGRGTKNVLDSLNLLVAWPMDSIAQVFELRTVIEGPTAAFAAQRRDERNLASLREALDMLKRLWKEKNPEIGRLGIQYNALLHTAIVGAAHNPVLLRVYEGMSKLYTESIVAIGAQEREKLPYEQWPEEVFEEHYRIVEAIRKKDADEAQAQAILHLKKSKERIESFVKK